MRNGIPPSEQEIQMIAMALNSMQLNNVPATNWPTLNEINYNDIIVPEVNLLLAYQREWLEL
jgi:hypothetical protein